MERKGLFQKLKLRWLSWQCPRFYEDMPKENKTGKWEIGSIVRSYWHVMERGNQVFEGSLIDAYVEARRIALREDRRTTHHEELGVDWFVRAVK